ncbi:exonuclease V [Echria macrotheca]|uniref:Exonuclease V n=1 Tax=Echria macrotheca TaxID=438768 RepID=A0AAJ0B354_9PEZI|nr:exonuclease V [Echria macrotheca]
MASFASSSDSDYGYDLTLSDEEQLIAVVDSLSPPRTRPPPPSTLRKAPYPAPAPAPRNPTRPHRPAPSVADSTASLENYLQNAIAAHETAARISESDLDLDPAELDSDGPAYSHGSGSDTGIPPPPPKPAPAKKRHLAPSVASRDSNLSAFVAQTKAKHAPRMLTEQRRPRDIQYPDLSRALSDAQKSSTDSRSRSENDSSSTTNSSNGRPPLLRFRTFPMKPLSVSDLTAGSWCELQHFYTLTRRDGKKTRTAAMKAGTAVHERLEREVYTTVAVEVRKREDNFGLKLWNIIQGLRTLRDTGIARELEVWGMVDGNVVNGIIDGLSYDNPDPELEEDVISSRGSQTSQSSQHQLSLGNKTIFVTDVKTRASKTPPSQAQVRAAIIQLFLYHRFLSQMASGRLDYLEVFKRYGLNPDETFSDVFMARIAALHEEVFSDVDSGATDITETTSDWYSTVSTPSKLGARDDLPRDDQNDVTFMKYRTLRSLLPLLKFEIQLTFPRGAATLGQIVAVEYRYRARTAADDVYQPLGLDETSDKDKAGTVICTNSFYFEPDTLDAYLADNLQFWRGEREPRGVPLEEGFKCRLCEFVGECEWRMNLEQEAYRRAKLENAEREKEAVRQRGNKRYAPAAASGGGKNIQW